ncbi:hypothetical protein DPEC_G00346250 [Dallia pectoralis]|uniref:Uncharacterized protein n=1 Tax=Dallia pectoralis TaxID=75939 RepID=A0ACC2F3R1_DALPE|nr:hypothetical protein DPEC_G00346250 [Dallia pectoralis]
MQHRFLPSLDTGRLDGDGGWRFLFHSVITRATAASAATGFSSVGSRRIHSPRSPSLLLTPLLSRWRFQGRSLCPLPFSHLLPPPRYCHLHIYVHHMLSSSTLPLCRGGE